MGQPSTTDASRTSLPRTGTRVTVAALVTGAVACAAVAALVPTDTWAAWFHHPRYDTLPGHTFLGAKLWRVMLGVFAGCLTAFAAVTPYLFKNPNLTPRTSDPVIAPGKGSLRSDVQTDDPASSSTTSVETWLILALLVAALLLRVARLGESLWYDEIALWLTYGYAGAGAIVGNYFDPVNHIAHSLITWLSVHLGESTLGLSIALRLPALLFSLLTVPIMFGLARSVFSRRVATIAALLVAVLPVMVFEGVEARGYSMMIALAAASTWMLILARRSHHPMYWSAYAALAALAVWGHMVTACVFVGHALWLTWRGWQERDGRGWLQGMVALGLAAILTLTLYAPVLPEVVNQFTGNFQHTSDNQPTLGGAEGLKMLWQVGGAWTWWVALPGLALVMFGLGSLWWDRRNEHAPMQRDALALLWLGWPVALLAVMLAGTWVYARFTLFVMPAAALTMALGIEWLWRRRWLIGATVLAVTVCVTSFHVLGRGPKQPLREAATYVQQQRQPHEAVAAVGIGHHVMRMYAGSMPMHFSPLHGRDLAQQFTAIPGGQLPRWIIVLYPAHLHPDADAAMRGHGYERVRTFDGWDAWGDVEIHRRRSPSP